MRSPGDGAAIWRVVVNLHAWLVCGNIQIAWDRYSHQDLDETNLQRIFTSAHG
jgi:hypothetical protein